MLENFALHATSPYCIHPSKRRAWLERGAASPSIKLGVATPCLEITSLLPPTSQEDM